MPRPRMPPLVGRSASSRNWRDALRAKEAGNGRHPRTLPRLPAPAYLLLPLPAVDLRPRGRLRGACMSLRAEASIVNVRLARKITINMLAFIAQGVITSMAGLTVLSWEYWALLALMMVAQINSSFD